MRDVLDRLQNRITRMFARGVLSFVDDSKTIQYVQAKLNALETIGDIPRIAEYGFTSNPPVGSEALVICGGGDRTNGVVIATSNAEFRIKALGPGEVAIHDNKGQSVILSAAGITINGGGLPITITNTPDILADTPLLKCTGEILDNCNTNTRTMSGMRTVANAHTHAVPNVQSGGSTVTSNPPTQAE